MKKKLNIGIDIDNVLVQTSKRIEEILNDYINSEEEKKIYQENLSEILCGNYPHQIKPQLDKGFQEASVFPLCRPRLHSQ